jgi:hypothetical protein
MSLSEYAPWLKADSFSKEDGYQLAGLCLAHFVLFSIVHPFFPAPKVKAWIVSLFGSFFMAIVGTKYVIEAGFPWTLEIIHGEDNGVSRPAVMLFCATMIMDLVLGRIYYPKYLDPLSAYIHHVFYLVFAFCLLAHHYARGLCLTFFMEWPTFMLSLGTLVPACRVDLMFGIVFFTTRIAYNIYFVYALLMVAPEGIIWKVCTAALCLHLFWFYKWITGFFKKRSEKVSKKE